MSGMIERSESWCSASDVYLNDYFSLNTNEHTIHGHVALRFCEHNYHVCWHNCNLGHHYSPTRYSNNLIRPGVPLCGTSWVTERVLQQPNRWRGQQSRRASRRHTLQSRKSVVFHTIAQLFTPRKFQSAMLRGRQPVMFGIVSPTKASRFLPIIDGFAIHRTILIQHIPSNLLSVKNLDSVWIFGRDSGGYGSVSKRTPLLHIKSNWFWDSRRAPKVSSRTRC
jgi:hypothetical protein